jgi:RNA polymerase sigma-70 factor (ECF subfamily)
MDVVSTDKRNQFPVRVRRAALELARQGPSALDGLYDLTSVRLLRYALTLTRNHEDAEDALQAAMIRITVKPQALSQAKYPWAYFLRIVRNEAITVVRRRKPVARLSPLTVPTIDAELALDDEEVRNQVRLAVRRLPPAQGEVVVLRIWEDMTFLEIASVLNQSPNTVASRFRYALEKLTRMLHSFENEPAVRSRK